MLVHALDLPFDPGALQGLSARLIQGHHALVYGAEVDRLNDIRSRLASASPAEADGPWLHGLKREELLATNSVRLHELYFDSLGGDGRTMEPALALALTSSFGGFEGWRAEFETMARALDGGTGWVLLVFQPREGNLVNQWAADPSQALVGGVPILALDMEEHAYQGDFGASAAAYVDAFLANVAWVRVHARYQAAVHAASEHLGVVAQEAEAGGGLWIDVRRAGAFAQAPTIIPGACWRDPAQVSAWASELPAGQELTVYCVHGHEVSRSTALRLRAAGVKARFLFGGIDGWQAAGLAVAPVRDPRDG